VAFNAVKRCDASAPRSSRAAWIFPRVNHDPGEMPTKFGLAQLINCGAAVGPQRRASPAWLSISGDAALSEAARPRLRAIRNSPNWAVGTRIGRLRDMEIRGVGNLLGFGAERPDGNHRLRFSLHGDCCRNPFAEIQWPATSRPLEDTQIDLPITLSSRRVDHEPDEKMAAPIAPAPPAAARANCWSSPRLDRPLRRPAGACGEQACSG